MSFRGETIAFHQRRIQELQANIEHFKSAIRSHQQVIDHKHTGDAERKFSERQIERLQGYVKDYSITLAEFQRGAVNFSIMTREIPTDEEVPA